MLPWVDSVHLHRSWTPCLLARAWILLLWVFIAKLDRNNSNSYSLHLHLKFLICKIQKHAETDGMTCPAISGVFFCTFFKAREWAESLPENKSMVLSFVFFSLINLKLFSLFTMHAFKFTMKLSSVKTTMICKYMNVYIFISIIYIYIYIS